MAPIEDAAVPVTVQAILAARIDRLDPDSKQLLQVASVVGKEVSATALGLTAGLEDEAIDRALRDLTAGGFLYEAEIYPQRVLAFRHPLTREVAYGTQLADRRQETHAAAARAMIELEADRLDELAGLVAQHMDEGGETLEAARWFARAAHRAGHSQPRDALRLWQRVMSLADELEESEETTGLAMLSRMLQLEYAWRLGMDREQADALAAEATAIATRCGDLNSLALLKLLTSARPGVAETSSEWVAAAEEAVALADESAAPDLRVAIRGAAAYAQLCAGDLDRLEATVDRILELTGDDVQLGAGIVVGCPRAWGLMAKGVAQRERGNPEAAEELIDEALRIATSVGDLETESWSLGTKATMLADRGEIEAGVALGLRNCELTERLGDVFSHTIALAALAVVHLEAGEFAAALETIERADGDYREAMGSGGEAEGWRGTLRARALLGLGREDEALSQAEWATDTARRRGMHWQLPPALLTLAKARATTGAPGVNRALDEAVEVASSHGHQMALERIRAERSSLSAA